MMSGNMLIYGLQKRPPLYAAQWGVYSIKRVHAPKKWIHVLVRPLREKRT